MGSREALLPVAIFPKDLQRAYTVYDFLTSPNIGLIKVHISPVNERSYVILKRTTTVVNSKGEKSDYEDSLIVSEKELNIIGEKIINPALETEQGSPLHFANLNYIKARVFLAEARASVK